MTKWNEATARQIIEKLMLGQDAFSQWLGIELLEIKPDSVRLGMKVSAVMTNGFHIAHGGIVYALCDSALAFISNSRNRKAVSIETQISHVRPIQIGDLVEVKASVLNEAKKLGRYSVLATNGSGDIVATFTGTVFFTGELWID